MTDPNKTLIALLVDRTGSMGRIRSDAEGAINNFLDEQKKVDADEASVSVYQFDRDYDNDPDASILETVFENLPIAEVPTISIEPRGNTPLNDALAFAINKVGAQLDNLPEDQRPGKVIFVVMTDGEENSSREYRDKAQVKAMVLEQTDRYGWEFVFLGAGIDAFAVGAGFGFRADQTISVAATGEGVTRGYAKAGAMTTSLRTRK
jgi:Mg-chelatase subunit ChlD